MLEALCRRPVPSALLEHELQRCPSAQVFRTANTAAVFIETAGNVERNTGVETAVGAAQDV